MNETERKQLLDRNQKLRELVQKRELLASNLQQRKQALDQELSIAVTKWLSAQDRLKESDAMLKTLGIEREDSELDEELYPTEDE